MKIWTQQKLAFWEELESNGIAYCNEESWLYTKYRCAYDWLAEQMHIRISPPPMPDIRLPLWGWVQYKNYKCRKPIFSPEKDENGYYPQVLIEAEIPDEMVLQSNFYLWECHCMNGWHIGDKQLQKKIDIFEDSNKNKDCSFIEYPDEIKQQIMESWRCIFNLNYRNRRYHDRPRRNKSIQATFWLLRMEWVKSVCFFIPK